MRGRGIHQRTLLRALAATLLVSLTLTGCQAVASSGPVREGLANLSQADQPVQFNPGGPTVGATQEDIVRGFVSAGSSSVDDYAIAREFLTPAHAQEWEPTLGVLIDEGTQSFRSTSENAGVLSVSAIAAVDERGSLQPVGPGAATDVRFAFEKVDGEWRISEAPGGIILDKSTFTAVWTPLPLYFPSTQDRLVPDTRWFLNRATITTQVVGELLAGPTEAMAEVLHSAFPTGTALLSGSVPVVEGTARIDLSPEILDAGPIGMEVVRRQLGASLHAVPEVSRYEILVNGSVVDGGPTTAAEGTSPKAENAYVAVLKGGAFGAIAGATVDPLPQFGDRIAALQPSAVTLAPDRASAAVRHPAGISFVTQDDEVLLDTRGAQLAPSLDRYGWVWSASALSSATVVVSRPGIPGVTLAMPWLGGKTPVALRVSQGGSRVAVLVADSADPGLSRVLVAGVVRDTDGTPVALTESAVVGLWAVGSPVDLDWIDELRVVAITSAGAAGKITQASLGQFATEAGSVPGAVAVSGGGNRALLRVLDDDGRLFAPQGSGWQRQQDGISLVARVG